MTSVTEQIRGQIRDTGRSLARLALRPRRLAVALGLTALALAPGELGSLTRSLMTDAWTQVSVFVALTFMIFYGAERLFGFDIGDQLRTAKGWQLPIASFLGATPGCGGAVLVVAAYSSGNVSFGAVVATLTATMGDAAFLLIAVRPDAAVVVIPLQFTLGIVAGWIVDRFNRVEFRAGNAATLHEMPKIGRVRPVDLVYVGLAALGLVVGFGQVAQIEVTTVLGIPVVYLALVATAIGLWVWATSPLAAMTNPADAPVTRTTEETAFISVWVIGAYLSYDYLTAFSGLDLAAVFGAVVPLLPLIAILAGFIPGCGPQVLVTTLYINGLIPFSALIGNAISNDGDALFPAIALNPRAAIAATLYSAVPALIVAYGFFLFAPGFLN